MKNSVAGGGKINPDYLKKLKPKRGIKTTFQVNRGKQEGPQTDPTLLWKVRKDPGRFVSFGGNNFKIY
jgi:hypothetical protein